MVYLLKETKTMKACEHCGNPNAKHFEHFDMDLCEECANAEGLSESEEE